MEKRFISQSECTYGKGTIKDVDNVWIILPLQMQHGKEIKSNKIRTEAKAILLVVQKAVRKAKLVQPVF